MAISITFTVSPPRIGPVGPEEKVGCECYEDEDWHPAHWIDYGDFDCDEQSGGLVICHDYYEYVHTMKPSDGFILTESSMNAPGLNYPVQIMDGSNHMQLKNDSRMEEAVWKIFEDSFGRKDEGFFYSKYE